MEREELELWLKNHNNYELFKGYVKINFLIDLDMDMFDVDDSKKQLLELIDKEKKEYRLRKYVNVFKYAAVVIIFLGIGYLYQLGCFTKTPEVIIPSDSITLKLENGNVEVLSEDGTSQILDANGSVVGSQKGKQLVYDNDNVMEKLVYNTLTVPYGKRFEVKLSDGTKVYLNAGTSLKYPVKFIGGNKRQVFLTGEAFFDVAHDVTHPFIVNMENLNVEVLGTEFNVSAYSEDLTTDVVLIKGSVNLYTNGKTLNEGLRIEPGIKGALNRKLGSITSEAVDTSIYTSWMEGDLVFRNMSFENIVKKLERYYNMKIIIVNKQLNNEIFNATFKDEPPIQDVLNSFGKSYGISHTIKDNAIFIN
ncbi:FecR family protein [Confluentibacter sediminis]|uniref:FecR family protein n=1 Tax=Confluentibacter sediminis TaxID=2219045 RepID=UPI0013A6EB7A|nr:FecR family protein [Confluentibacter sediminis]